MRAFVICLLLALACLAAAAAPPPDFSLSRTDLPQMFADFKEFYGKSYSSDVEEELRFYNFVDFVQRAKDLNAEHNTPGLYGVTKFADLSTAEFKAKYLLPPSVASEMLKNRPTSNLSVSQAIKITNPQGHVIMTFDGKMAKPAAGLNPNTLYDWTANGFVSPIKNQLQCGSCWAFSAVEQIESNYAMHHGLPPPLSVQQVVNCDTTSYGCGGGWTSSAYQYVQGAGGLETEATLPYTAVQGPCNAAGPKAVQISGYQSVSQGDEGGMFNFVQGGGPISVCLNANNFETYTGNNQILPGSTCTDQVDHCVQVTGFLTDGNANMVAWNVRNSWGPDWGNSGSALLQYGVNACNINSAPTIVTI